MRAFWVFYKAWGAERKSRKVDWLGEQDTPKKARRVGSIDCNSHVGRGRLILSGMRTWARTRREKMAFIPEAAPTFCRLILTRALCIVSFLIICLIAQLNYTSQRIRLDFFPPWVYYSLGTDTHSRLYNNIFPYPPVVSRGGGVLSDSGAGKKVGVGERERHNILCFISRKVLSGGTEWLLMAFLVTLFCSLSVLMWLRRLFLSQSGAQKIISLHTTSWAAKESKRNHRDNHEKPCCSLRAAWVATQKPQSFD